MYLPSPSHLYLDSRVLCHTPFVVNKQTIRGLKPNTIVGTIHVFQYCGTISVLKKEKNMAGEGGTRELR